MSQALCLPLRDMVRGYKTELRRLHPFEKVVADLTVRARQKKDGLTLMAILVSSGVVSDMILSQLLVSPIQNTHRRMIALAG